MRSFATPLTSALLCAGFLVPSIHSAAASAAPVFVRGLQQDEAAAAAPALLAIRAGRVIVKPGHELENAIVLVRGDVLQAVGTDVVVPEGTPTVEAAVVCAGFIDAWSGLTVDRGSLFDRGVKPSTRTVDAIDAYSDAHLRAAAVRAGVTTVRAQVGVASNIQGTSAVVRLLPDLTDPRAILDDSAAVSVAVQGNDALERVENVDRLLGEVQGGATYRTAQRKYVVDLEAWTKAIAEKEAQLEKDFKKAKKDREKAIADAEKEGKEHKETPYKEDRRPKAPRVDLDADAMGAVAEGEMPLVIELHRVPEMRQLLARLPEFGRVRPILAGVSDARFLAEELADLGATVIVDPTAPSRGGTFGANQLELAAALDEAGVQVIFGTGGVDGAATAALPLLAARAVGHGLSREAALDALTLGPARALALDHRIGSVEVGKQADLLLLSGDPFASATRVEQVLIAGEAVLNTK
jgi:imidazolonepropionase-like amidohydrolase